MRGLGYNNLLFMAAELLLLQSHPDQVPFLLIEEPEAHLHPQHQTLFMEVLAARAKALTEAEKSEGLQQVQVLLTTHSPQLAAAADLETLTMIVGHRAFPLASGQTKLEPDDYEFLRRFLDATKANLFFARGLIVVEGDAENILFPAIAEKMGRPLSRHGVSIVNVGHRGLFRYSRVLQRAAEPVMAIPVALIPDRDIPPAEAKVLVGKRETENELDGRSAEEATGDLAGRRRRGGQGVRVRAVDARIRSGPVPRPCVACAPGRSACQNDEPQGRLVKENKGRGDHGIRGLEGRHDPLCHRRRGLDLHAALQQRRLEASSRRAARQDPS